MKKIHILKEKRESLCEELAKIVKEFSEYDRVKCIYFVPYESNISPADVIAVIIVRERNNETSLQSLERHIENYNWRLLNIDNQELFGIDIGVQYDTTESYKEEPKTPVEFDKSNFLFNGTILYDPTGKFKKIKEAAEKISKNNNEIREFANLDEIIPPLTDETQAVHLNNGMLIKRKMK